MRDVLAADFAMMQAPAGTHGILLLEASNMPLEITLELVETKSSV